RAFPSCGRGCGGPSLRRGAEPTNDACRNHSFGGGGPAGREVSLSSIHIQFSNHGDLMKIGTTRFAMLAIPALLLAACGGGGGGGSTSSGPVSLAPTLTVTSAHATPVAADG